MIIPAVGGVGGGLALGQTEALAQGVKATPATAASGGAPALGGPEPVGGGPEPVGGSEPSGFGGTLSEVISSLEKTQQSSDSAAQALASGTVKDPESAVVTVEDAQMAMELAAQIRSKATEAAQTIFQTQV
jgi:flagellar hook-basal body complex protein FliE